MMARFQNSRSCLALNKRKKVASFRIKPKSLQHVYLAAAMDYKPRTAKQVAELLGIKPVNATNLLLRLKVKLAINKSPLKLIRTEPTSPSTEILWTICDRK